MQKNKPLLVTIANEAWCFSHLLRWFRYAKANSGCRLGLILISDNTKLIAELTEQFDKIEVYPAGSDCRDFYNEVRLIAPVLFEEPVIYMDCDADVWGDLSETIEQVGDTEISCVKSPGHFPDWDEKVGKGRKEYNNGFLVLNYDTIRAQEIAELYGNAMEQARKGNPRVSGSIAFNLLIHDSDVTWGELPYCNSVIWWDDLALRDAKVIQWCNDKGQAKRLALEAEWVRGGEAL